MSKNFWTRILYRLRDVRISSLFDELGAAPLGRVLDVGGWDFVLTARRRGLAFDRWVTLDRSLSAASTPADPSCWSCEADGTRIPVRDATFDTVLNIQVLEHVVEPLEMMKEMTRALRPGGRMILLVPCTADLHLAPHHYSNFTRHWCEEAVSRSGLELVRLDPLGGVWSTLASRHFYFFLHALRLRGFSGPAHQRGVLFPFLFPFMVLWSLVAIPVCMLLSLGDLSEEPNNHLVVARKPADGDVPTGSSRRPS